MLHSGAKFNRFISALIVLLTLAVAYSPARAASFKTIERWNKAIAPGINYSHIRMTVNGLPLHAHVVKISLSEPGIDIRPILANNRLDSLETTASMARRTGASVAINGSFFNRSSSDPFPVGFMMINGRTVYFSHTYRSAFGLTEQKVPLFGYPKTRGIIYMEKTGEYFFLWGMNRKRRNDESLVFTPEYGAKTNTNENGREVRVSGERVVGLDYGDSLIPNDGFVLSLHGDSEKYFNWFKRGDSVRLYFVVDPAWLDVHNAITGGPMLLKNGECVLEQSKDENLRQGFRGRIPATAIGSTADGQLLLVVIDGRQRKFSVGVTYWELAEFMKSFGAINAIGMDGGGSSSLVINGVTVNSPSDGASRAVSNAIGVFIPGR
ncbi:MAG: phosphodiester glycosidase family protein [bacterium]